MIRRNAVVLGLAVAICSVAKAPAAETLESSVLRLEVNTDPYSYRVVERASGDVLIAETGGISFTESRYTVKNVTGISKIGDTLRITFRLNGISGVAQALFRFRSPEVLQSTFSFHDGIPGEIREEFRDQGEHYYGIWEMPISGALDNRGADQDFLGMRPHPGVNYSSARARGFQPTSVWRAGRSTNEFLVLRLRTRLQSASALRLDSGKCPHANPPAGSPGNSMT